MNRYHQMTSKSGLSLVEIIIYTALSGIFLTIVLSVLVNFFTSRQQYLALDALDATATRTFRLLARDLHRAGDFEIEIYPNNSQSLTIMFADNSEEVIYSVEDNRLTRDYLIYSNEKVAFEQLDFTPLTSGEGTIPAVKINLVLSAQYGHTQAESTYETTVSLRRIPFALYEEEN